VCYRVVYASGVPRIGDSALEIEGGYGRGGVFEKGERAPWYQQEIWGRAVSSPNGVRGSASPRGRLKVSCILVSPDCYGTVFAGLTKHQWGPMQCVVSVKSYPSRLVYRVSS